MKMIETIEIKNFKSIRHQKIEGCKRINVFIGYPNVGKSNILEALGLFSIDKPNVDFTSFVRTEQLTTLFFDGDINKGIEIRINDENRMVASLESNAVHFAWQLLSSGASFDKMAPGIQQKIYGMLSFTKNEGGNKILNWDSIFKRQPRSTEFYKELGQRYLADIKKYSFQKSIVYSSGKYDSLETPNGDNIFGVINTHIAIKKEIEELFLAYKLELAYDQREQKFIILKRISSGIFSIPYELVADTLQRLIFFKVATLSNKNSILLFEEPEAHMFPPYISKFTADVMYDEGKNQFFIATHSPFVLNDFMENLKSDSLSIYVVGYKKETGETIIRKLSESELNEIYQYGIDLYFNLENYLMHEQQ
jgi:AAA15 family ATPase/GTPase